MARSGSVRALAVAALVAAGLALTGCGGHGTPKAHTVAKPSCSQQMTTWGKKAQPALSALNKARTALSRAAAAEDLPDARAGLEHAGAAAARMETTPIPHCVDPGGHYLKWLDGIKAAGDNARAEGGEAGIRLAEEALPRAQRQLGYLNAELSAAGYTKM